MARIFSINFMHDGLPRSAMVTVRPTPFFTEYLMSLLDEDVAEQLPDNRIISNGADFRFASPAKNEETTELMREILHAVAEHMHTTPV